MKKVTSRICAAAIALSMGGFAAPATAGPLALPTVETPLAQPLTKVDFRYRYGGGMGDVRSHVDQLTGVPTRHRSGRHWRGHRGHWDRDSRWHRRHWRHRHRHDNDFIGPAAGFIAGAIIGNVLSQGYDGGGYVRLSRAHVDWCDDRYRSYRVRDNTFQPYNGPRKQCISPYY